jgi:hypothetical protein
MSHSESCLVLQMPSACQFQNIGKSSLPCSLPALSGDSCHALRSSKLSIYSCTDHIICGALLLFLSVYV